MKRGGILCLTLLAPIGCSSDPKLIDTEELLNQAPQSSEQRYRCDDGTQLDTRYEQANDEMVVFLNHRAVRLTRERAASGTKYSADDIVFWNKGDRASLSRGNGEPVACRAIDTEEDASRS
ncbi:membrane-bound inhibitor of C-type lysozyme [Methylohalomonas lacus]|uniref:Membrane-bound inhibitor of C-type lysozyme n=1 Tax=Methylohalomonas lacus TaxID=398773 RepID=A0AAE3L5J4_9GAMM|nr:MliC family protein [Methylohalomonas lacus]MCS3903417.1 membrane-bound inhibitor of C-type lysozyme [Methylohalomonas lacus]